MEFYRLRKHTNNLSLGHTCPIRLGLDRDLTAFDCWGMLCRCMFDSHPLAVNLSRSSAFPG